MNCLKCERVLNNLDANGFQPDRGLAFITYGHYGSTVFDPMDETFLEVAICDECIKITSAIGLVQHGMRPLDNRRTKYRTWKAA